MNTIEGEFYDPRDYISDEVMITPNQRKKLTELIYYNFSGWSNVEGRLAELENLTSVEAEDMIFQYLSATWN